MKVLRSAFLACLLSLSESFSYSPLSQISRSAIWPANPLTAPRAAPSMVVNTEGRKWKDEPLIIQGGMGIAVSGYELANACAREGQLGIVSQTSIDNVLARRLQDGDLDGSQRRAMAAFPDQEMAQRVLDMYFIEGGRDPSKPYKQVPMFTEDPRVPHLELTVVASFVEVWLGKEGHDGLVGVNL